MLPSDDTLKGNREAYEANKDRNIFVIMRYGSDRIYKALEKAVKEAVRSYGFEAKLARDMLFYSVLWRNIEFCMTHSRYGIVIFEHAMQPEFNPNVAVELGYMLGLGKSCLLLKEHSLPTLPTDVVGHLYEPFEVTNPKASVSRSVERWLEKLGHQRIKSTEVIAGEDVVETKKKRTRKVIEALLNMKKAHGCILRQAGSLSSLAISESEGILFAEDPDLKRLLLQERDAMESLIASGITVRCLISPFVQIANFHLKVLSVGHVHSDILPRFKQLCSVLDKHRDNPNLQIACTSRLPHGNILIDEVGCRVFLGKKLLKQWGFPHTTIYHDPIMVRSEADRFDSAFSDAVEACLGKAHSSPEDYGSVELKLEVIEYLHGCETQLVNMTVRR